MAQRFRPLRGSAMVVRRRLVPALDPGVLTLARGLGTIRRADLFAADFLVFPDSVMAREIHPPLVARAFAAGSFPGTGCPSSAVVDPFRPRIGLVIVAVRLFAAAGPDPAAAVVVAAGLAVACLVRLSRIAGSDCPVCPSAAATGKGRVVARVVFCFLVPRSSSLRTRSALLPIGFPVPP